MLLIAMSKSASTSLAATIAKIGNLNCKLGISRIDIDIDCDEFKYLQKCHDNMIERSSTVCIPSKSSERFEARSPVDSNNVVVL